jgi:hypothetical protein
LGKQNNIDGSGNKVYGNNNLIINDLSGFDFWWFKSITFIFFYIICKYIIILFTAFLKFATEISK